MRTPYIASRVAALNRGDRHAQAERVRLATLRRVLCRTAGQRRPPGEMCSMRRTLTAIPAFAAMLVVALSVPSAVSAEDQPLPAAEQALAPAAIPGPAGSVEASRVRTAQHALLSPNLGSRQEETLRAVVAAAMTWDQTSGYAVVEAIRAEPDVSVAPAAGTTTDAASGVGAGVVNRVANAQHALAAGNLGSLQEEALTAVVTTGSSWDDRSGYGPLEAARATIGHPLMRTTQVPSDVRWAPAGTTEPGSSIEASRAVSPDYLPAALTTGTRTESAHLATVALPADAVNVNPSDDRIAAALFDDEPSGEDAAVAVPHRTPR
jgi:hypothetical protein